MKILFSPSETKTNKAFLPAINEKSFIFRHLYEKRMEVIGRYQDIIQKQDIASLSTLFGIKDAQKCLALSHINLFSALTCKAIERYDGVAYDYLHYPTLLESAQNFIDHHVLIFSNLFGPLLAGENIPEYKLSQGETLEGFKPELFYKEAFSPSLSATSTKSPKIGHSMKKYTLSATHYDTFDRKRDTFNLCKVNDIYYFRTRVKNKLYRKSLKTSNLKKAIVRAKLLKSMKKDELIEMFELKDKDYHLLFEYDTIEELEMLLETARKMRAIEQKQAIEDNSTLQKEQSKHFRHFQHFTFEELELEFLVNQKKIGKVSNSSFKNYNSAFVKLKRFFLTKDINTLDYVDLEKFRDNLISLELNNKTINNLMAYVNQFLEFALNRRKIEYNPAKSIQSLKEEKKQKENFTDEEINKLLSETLELKDKPHMFPLFFVAAFTGMRFNEILDINEESIKTDKNGIRYIDIGASKTSSGIRKVPLHTALETFDFSPLYPLSSQDKNKYDKEMLRVLYTIIPKDQEKTFHTLRATFINRVVNNFPDKVHIVQEIVGHSKGSKSITLDTYSKEFNLDLKKEIIDTVRYG